MLVRITFDDSRASATASAMARPITKLITVSGIVMVIAALASGPRLFRISCQVDTASGPPDASALRYFFEMLASVPSARNSSRALLRSGNSPLFLRAAKPCSLFSPVVPAILTVCVTGLGEIRVHGDAVVDHQVDPALVEQFDGLSEPLDGLDARSVLACDLCPVARGRFPATLPLMSSSDLTELSSALVTMTPSPTEYGSDRSYFCFRSALIVTSLATTSNRLASRAREDRIPRRFDEFDLHAELVADRASDVDVVTDELAGGGIVVAERRVDAFGADPQHPRCRDRFSPLVFDDPHAVSTSAASSSTAEDGSS